MEGRRYIVIGIMVASLAVLENIQVGEQEVLIVEKTVAMQRPRAKIFQFLADMRNYAQWFPGVLRFEPTDTAPMSTGKHFHEVHYIPVWGEHSYDSVITGYESPSYVSWYCDSWFEVRNEVSVQRSDSNAASTIVTLRQYSRKNTVLFQYGVLPLMRHFLSQKARHAMFNLRFLMEA